MAHHRRTAADQCLLAAALLIPVPAMAYIDAGTGSLVIQGLIAFLLGTAYTLKGYLRALMQSVRARLGGQRAPEMADPEAAAAKKPSPDQSP